MKVNGVVASTPDRFSTSATIASTDVSGGLTNGTPITIEVCSVNDVATTCSAASNHTVGQIVTGTVDATTTFPHTDIFQVLGNGYTNDFTSAWTQPVSTTSGNKVLVSAPSTVPSTDATWTTDHNATTGWSVASGNVGWITWDFGASRSVVPQAFKINWANYTAKTYFEASNDGTNWTTLWRGQTSSAQDVYGTTTARWTNDDSYRYLRMYRTDTVTGWFSVREIEVYGRVHLYPTVNPWTTAAAAYTLPSHVTTAQQGSYVYIAGGGINGVWTNSFLRYDITTGTMTSLAPLPRAVDSAAAVIYNNNFYLIGGRYAATSNSRDIQVYNIATNTWSTLVDKVNASYGHTGVLVDSKVYMFGGVENGLVVNTGRVLDLASANITQTSIATMGSVFLTSIAGVLSTAGDYVFLFGGYNQSSVPSTVVLCYKLASNTMYNSNALGEPKALSYPVAISGGRIALVGGMTTGQAAATKIDVVTTNFGTFTLSGSYPLTNGRMALGAGYYNGKLVAFGGMGSSPGYAMRNNLEYRSGM